jgi:hypothetical protein
MGWLVVLALTAGASIVSTAWAWGTTDMKVWARPYFWLPVLFAAVPLLWPRRSGLATGLLVAYVFFPLSLSIGVLFVPAAVAGLIVWYQGRPRDVKKAAVR